LLGGFSLEIDMITDPISYYFFKKEGSSQEKAIHSPVVLMYHSIQAPGKVPNNRWEVSAEKFSEQMKFLKKEGWKTFLFRDLLQVEKLPAKSVVITFDDGFLDNYDYGFKVLNELEMCATWFIVSGRIGQESNWVGGDGKKKVILFEDKIVEMFRAGMEIGAHTRNHYSLPDLDASELRDEIYGSKKDLESIIGNTIVSFAYPFGRYNDLCLKLVREAEFLISCTTDTGRFDPNADIHKVRRIPVFSFDTLSSFARKIAFADSDVRWSKMTNYISLRLLERIKRI
jgi:peptidoglycan/xylan/chitin deacetylase (PgdA/CDA1 family)